MTELVLFEALERERLGLEAWTSGNKAGHLTIILGTNETDVSVANYETRSEYVYICCIMAVL